MKQSEFNKIFNELGSNNEEFNRGGRSNTSWIEIKGFKSIAHMTPAAYLFNHELGQCWMPKAAVKFERKIDFDNDDAEYRILVASWFKWEEKVKLMKEGKIVSDDFLENRAKAEASFGSIMPKTKTPKREKFINQESDNKKYTKDDFPQIFGPIPGVQVIKDSIIPVTKSPSIPSDFELTILSELNTLKQDRAFYKVNNSADLVLKTDKKIFLLLLEKKKNGFKLSLFEKSFFRNRINTTNGEKWQMEFETGVNPDDVSNLNRAIDL